MNVPFQSLDTIFILQPTEATAAEPYVRWFTDRAEAKLAIKPTERLMVAKSVGDLTNWIVFQTKDAKGGWLHRTRHAARENSKRIKAIGIEVSRPFACNISHEEPNSTN